MSKKPKMFTLTLHFMSEDDLQDFVERHFNKKVYELGRQDALDDHWSSRYTKTKYVMRKALPCNPTDYVTNKL